ncbi:DUF4296 domain-containing protein [Terrimonas pollutisoli]|uniref:DUF4296 domain-containing protein n=1 Tax=Terrimonas pollutisoli TaxID=3034147 RepID=UPI0023ECEAD8|nr:DUF4296 domain-containing protein [Terrimonas sp. H1YJ31]
MRKFLLVGLIFPIVFSCSNKDKLPAGILSRQKMREVVWDMSRTAEFLNGFVFNKDSSIDKIAESEKWYNKVYQLHKTTKKEFERSYSYYQSHPDLMRELLDSLSKKTMPIRPPKPTKDSTILSDSIKKRIPPPFKSEIQNRIIDSIRKRRIQKKNIRAV